MKQYHIINVFQLTLTSMFFFSAILFLTAKLDSAIADSYKIFDWDIATVSLIVTAVGTFFAILFRWRADARNSKLFEERMERSEARFAELEYEIELIKSKLDE